MSIQALVETIKYVNQFRGKTFLVKLGGSILHDDDLIKLQKLNKKWKLT